MTLDKKLFKKLFNEIATTKGFVNFSNFWYIESEDCILCIDLQKSSYSDLYYLNINIFVQGALGKKWKAEKNLWKQWPTASTRAPTEYSIFLDFDNKFDMPQRTEGIKKMFDDYLEPFAKKALTLNGVKELFNTKQVHLDVPDQIDMLLAKKTTGAKE